MLACAAVLVVPATGAPAAGRDGPELRLNHVQLLGTHNSYHVRPDRALTANEPADYEHAPLREQLEEQGVRNLELDVYDGPDLPVFHSILVDEGSRCATLELCLGEIAAWSDDHRDHVPLVLFVEPKRLPTSSNAGTQLVIDTEAARRGLSDWDAAGFDRLDRVVRDAFGDRLITPDEVRGKRATLRDAVRRDGWPALADVRGGVLVVLNVNEELLDLYLDGHRTLRRRPMFAPSDGGDDHAAIVKRDVPQPRAIPRLVRDGFIVSTRTDANAVEARANDPTRAGLAIASGAQIVVTDYPVPDPSIGTYVVALPGGAVARCNPVVAPARCRDRELGT